MEVSLHKHYSWQGLQVGFALAAEHLRSLSSWQHSSDGEVGLALCFNVKNWGIKRERDKGLWLHAKGMAEAALSTWVNNKASFLGLCYLQAGFLSVGMCLSC